MLKWFWRLFIGLTVGSIIVGSLALLWLAFFFDPEDYKDQLIGWVSERTGSPLTIDGQLIFDLGFAGGTPVLKFIVSDLAFKNTEQFSSTELFNASKITIAISAVSMIQGRIHPMVTIEKPKLKLIRVDSSTVNWHHIGNTVSGRNRPLSEWELIRGFAGISLGGIHVIDGSVHWTRIDTNTEIKISEFEFEVKASKMQRTGSIHARLDLNHESFRRSVVVDSGVDIVLDQKSESIRAENVRIDLTGPLTLVTLAIDQMGIDENNQQVQFTIANLSGAVQGEEFLLRLKHGVYSEITDNLIIGTVAASWIGNQIEGSAQLAEVSIGSISERLTSYVSRERPVVNLNRSDSFLEAIDSSISASGNIAFSVSDWSRILMSDFTSLTGADRSLNAMINLTVGEYGLEISNFDLSWVDSSLRGSLLRTGDGEKILNFDVIEGYVDLPQTASFSTNVTHNPAITLLMMFFGQKGIVSTGNIIIERAKIGRLSLSQLDIPVRMEKDGWVIDVATFDAYGGKGNINVVINRSHDHFVLDTRQKYSGVDVGDILSDIGLTGRIKAIGNVNIAMATKQPFSASELRSARGKISIVVPQGQVYGLGSLITPDKEVAQVLEGILAPIGLDLGLTRFEDDIAFSEFVAVITLKDGQFLSDDTSFNALGWKLEGKSKYNLNLDWYDSIWYLSRDVAAQTKKSFSLDGLKSVIIPIRVTGQPSSLSVALDIPELLRLLSQ